MKPSSLPALGPESLVKNVTIALYFACSASLLTMSRLFTGRDLVTGKSVAIVAAVGLGILVVGALLVMPRRAKPSQNGDTPRRLPSAAEKKYGPVLPESLVKNVTIAVYFAGGSWLLTASRTFQSFGFGPALKITLVGLVWVCLGAWLLIPNRRKIEAEGSGSASTPSAK